MKNKPEVPLDVHVIRKAPELTRLLDSVASVLGTDLDYLTADEQLVLMMRALEIRSYFKERAQRFVAHWRPDDE